MRLPQLMFGLLLLVGCDRRADERAPAIGSLDPSITCNVRAETLTISGENFDPLPVATLTAAESVLVPDISAPGLTLHDEVWMSNNTMTVVIPAGEAAGTYDITATNPLGTSTTLLQALQVVPPPSLNATTSEPPGVLPAAGANHVATPVTVHGQNFREGAQVTLTKSGADPATPIALTQVAVTSATTISGTVPAGITPEGAYDVSVRNQEGCSVTLAGGFTVTSPNAITVTAVDPAFGFYGEKTLITISGLGFSSTPEVSLLGPGSAVTKLTRISFLNATTLSALVPESLPVGLYALRVINPASDPGEGTLMSAFEVTDIAIPKIVFVTSDVFKTSEAVDTVACGHHLGDSTTIAEAVSQTTSTAAALTVGASTGSPCPAGMSAIRLTRPAGLGTSGHYAVRVRAAADPRLFTDYFTLVVVNPSANFAPFSSLTTTLVQPRRGAAAVSARNDLGQRFVYLIGGDAPASTAEGLAPTPAPILLDTVDIAPVVYSRTERAHDLAPFFSSTTKLPQARFSAEAVAVENGQDRFIYLFGGAVTGATAATGVLRAKVLPEQSGVPSILDVASTPGTGLAAGSYYYKVSAVMPAAGDVDETLPSDENGITSSTPGAVSITFTGVASATSYRVYRTPSGAAVSQGERLLTQIDASLICTNLACSFTDDGTHTLGSATPLAHGSLGPWREVAVSAGAGTFALWGARAALYSTNVTAGTRGYIYLTGGTTDGATPSNQLLRLRVDDALMIGNADTSVPLQRPTFFHGAVPLTKVTSTVRDELYVTFGRGAGATNETHYQHATITPATGALSMQPQDMSKTRNLFGHGLLGIGAKLFTLGGATDASTLAASAFDAQVPSNNASGDVANFNNASESPNVRRFLPSTVRVGAYVFLIGGFGASVLASVERGQFVN